MICALAALKANDPYLKSVVCHYQLSEVLLAEGPRCTPVQQSFHRLGYQHAHFDSKRRSLHIVQHALEPSVARPCKSDPSFDLWYNVGACLGKMGLYFCPAASMTSGEVRSAWFGVRNSMVPVFFSNTVRLDASNTVTTTGIILARPPAEIATVPAWSAYSTPQTALCTRVSLEINKIP